MNFSFRCTLLMQVNQVMNFFLANVSVLLIRFPIVGNKVINKFYDGAIA